VGVINLLKLFNNIKGPFYRITGFLRVFLVIVFKYEQISKLKVAKIRQILKINVRIQEISCEYLDIYIALLKIS